MSRRTLEQSSVVRTSSDVEAPRVTIVILGIDGKFYDVVFSAPIGTIYVFLVHVIFMPAAWRDSNLGNTLSPVNWCLSKECLSYIKHSLIEQYAPQPRIRKKISA
jgi:hypothetical protein